MIKKIEKNDVESVLSFLGEDVFSVRIKANLSAYGTDYSFAEFWAQYDENNSVCAVLSKINGACTLVINEKADTDELKSFLFCFPYVSAFLSSENAALMDIDITHSGDILVSDSESINAYGNIPDFTDMKAAFELIRKNEGNSVAALDYLEWLSDFTYKRNRGYARLKAIEEDGKLISFAMTSAETKSSAIISGVFTDEDSRNRGYGEKVLMSLVSSLKSENKTVYIMTAEEKLTAFYEKRGFKKIGKWSEGKQ